MNARGKSENGNTLIIALIAIIVLSGTSAAFLSISVYRNKEAVMGRDYMKAFYAAGAGVSASIAEITADHDYDSDGKGDVSGDFDGGQYSVTAVDEGNDIWTLTSTGTYNDYRRGIEAVIGRRTSSPFEQAAFGGSSIDVSGISLCDSYDSDQGPYADQVDGDHAGENGGVGSNGNIVASESATVYGDATPGPYGSVTITDDAYISGSTAPGEEEREIDPYTYTPVGSSLGHLDSSTTLSSGTYRYSEIKLTSSDTVILGQSAGDEITLYIDSTIGVSGQARIVVYSDADGSAKVVMHHGAGKASFTGGGLVNTSQIPANFIFYSATTEAVKFAGSSDFYGAAYAPSAPVTATGNSAFFGSVVGNTVTVSGTGDIHYDEALAKIQIVDETRYEAKSWREFRP